MQSSQDVDNNLKRTVTLIRQAAEAGAEVVALPENFAFMGSDEQRALVAQDLEGPILETLRAEAVRNSILVLGGTYLVKSLDDLDERPYNTSVFLDRGGEIIAVYRKIHLFDVSLANGATYNESEHIRAGEKAVTAECDGVTWGLSICYDLRFPELYRDLAGQGAQVVFVPAAFTLATGKDHWLPLLQARAIENQVYIVAPAQFGGHDSRRQTYGHSAIIDPWGIVLAQAPERESVILGEFNAEYMKSIRARIPVFKHRRPDIYGKG